MNDSLMDQWWYSGRGSSGQTKRNNKQCRQRWKRNAFLRRALWALFKEPMPNPSMRFRRKSSNYAANTRKVFFIDRSNEAIKTHALPFCVIHLSRLELAFLVSSKIARSPRIFHSSDYFSDDSRWSLVFCVSIAGINDAVIQNEIPNLDVKQRATAINNLLLSGKIDIFK